MCRHLDGGGDGWCMSIFIYVCAWYGATMTWRWRQHTNISKWKIKRNTKLMSYYIVHTREKRKIEIEKSQFNQNEQNMKIIYIDCRKHRRQSAMNLRAFYDVVYMHAYWTGSCNKKQATLKQFQSHRNTGCHIQYEKLHIE